MTDGSSDRFVDLVGAAPTAADASHAIYERLAGVYDIVYGVLLQHGRNAAIARLAPAPGETILEVGIGTAWSARRYPSTCRVVGVDLSASMLDRARRRLTRQKIRHVRLCRADGIRLPFRDGAFDAVFAPYVVNVVPDPLALAREFRRVCRPGGRFVLLNHFERAGRRPVVQRLVGRLAVQISGVNWNLHLEPFLHDAGLTAESLEDVNVPRVSSVVVCRPAR